MAKWRGGDKWQAKIDRVVASLKDAAAVDVGFLPGATYPNGTPVALVAAVQNFGAPSRHIPPRPFFSEMILENKGHWPRDVVASLKRHDFEAKHALEDMGMLIKGELQQKINTFSGVPLKPETVRRKGHDKQLIETAHMVNSVDYQVVK